MTAGGMTMGGMTMGRIMKNAVCGICFPMEIMAGYAVPILR